MRLIGVGAIAFILFALVALLSERSFHFLERYGFVEGDFVVHTLGYGDTTLPRSMSGKAGHVDIPIAEYDEWKALTGFSGAAEFSVPILRSTYFSHAALYINLDAALEKGTTGRLKISVNGSERGEIVLDSGASVHEIQLPLTPVDQAARWADITLSVLGNNPKTECASDWTGGVVISVLPSTHIRFALEEPVSSAQDKVLVSGSPARIIWKGQTIPSGQQATIDLPWQWLPFTLNAIFVDPSQAEKSDADVEFSQIVKLRTERLETLELTGQLEKEIHTKWPVPILNFLQTDSDVEFRNQVNWELNFSQAEMPQQEVPDILDLELSVFSSGEINHWLLWVQINGHIIYSERIDGSEQAIKRRIPLPTAFQHIDNTLKINLVSDEEKLGRCAQGQAAVANIAASSSLGKIGGETHPIYKGIYQAATNEIDLYISNNVGAKEANFGFYTLSKIFRFSDIQQVSSDLTNTTLKRGLIALLDQDEFETALSNSKGKRDQIWVAFTYLSDTSEPEILVFRGNDPELAAALEIHKPISAIFVAPPGYEI